MHQLHWDLVAVSCPTLKNIYSPKWEQSISNGYDFWRHCLLYRAHIKCAFFCSSRHFSHSKHIAPVSFGWSSFSLICRKCHVFFSVNRELSETATIIKTITYSRQWNEWASLSIRPLAFGLLYLQWFACCKRIETCVYQLNCSLNAHQRSELQTKLF